VADVLSCDFEWHAPRDIPADNIVTQIVNAKWPKALERGESGALSHLAPDLAYALQWFPTQAAWEDENTPINARLRLEYQNGFGRKLPILLLRCLRLEESRAATPKIYVVPSEIEYLADPPSRPEGHPNCITGDWVGAGVLFVIDCIEERRHLLSAEHDLFQISAAALRVPVDMRCRIGVLGPPTPMLRSVQSLL